MDRRRSRMRRQSIGKRIEITERDVEIFRLLARFRYLRSTYLHAFLGGNRKRFIERLGHLYHEGYLDRPERQWEFAGCRYMPVIYETGRNARRILGDMGVERQAECVLAQGKAGASRQFSHQVMIAEILASIDLGTRHDGSLRFIGLPEILDRAPKAGNAADNSPKIPVSFDYRAPGASNVQRETTHVVPDGLFGLEYVVNGKRSYRFFVLEADRGTMPVARRSIRQSSYLKKLLAYREIARHQVLKTYLGLPNFLVLTVTTSEQRRRSLMRALEELPGSQGKLIFLFGTFPTEAQADGASLPSTKLLTLAWERAGHAPLAINMA